MTSMERRGSGRVTWMHRAPPAKRGLTRRAALMAALGAVAFPPRPALAQSLLGGLRGSLDATHEGLTPGAAEDQGALLNRALARAGEGGQPLFLPPGRYDISQVETPAYAHLIGVPRQTRLVFRGGPFMLRAKGADMLRMERMTVEGAGRPLDASASGLLDADTVGDLVIDDCEFSGSAADSITLRSCAGRVERSRFAAAREAGIHLIESRGMAVADNVVVDCGDTGILVARYEEGADGTLVRGNRVASIRADSGGTGQNGNGINLDKANGVIIADNRIEDCAFSAIRCFSSDNLQVTGNIGTRSGEVGIFVEFAFEGVIVANNLVDDAVGGISFANFMEHGGRLGICSGNIVRNIRSGSRYADGNPQIGIGIGAEADMAISGNIIENAVWGLSLGWGPYLRDVAATGNTIRASQIGIAVSVAEGAGAAIIADNLISGALDGAILGMRWEEVATADLVTAGAEEFPHLTISGNRTD
jgi:uncharacterized secreted repeat protein (TIGR03808 family)